MLTIRRFKLKRALVWASAIFIHHQAVMASDQWSGVIVGVSPSSRASLDLYSQPAMDSAVRSLATQELSFPLSTSTIESGFYRIEWQGKPYWVRSANVRLQRRVPSTCAIAAADGPTGSMPGAMSENCPGPNTRHQKR